MSTGRGRRPVALFLHSDSWMCSSCWAGGVRTQRSPNPMAAQRKCLQACGLESLERGGWQRGWEREGGRPCV
jgi:hypothetical protein